MPLIQLFCILTVDPCRCGESAAIVNGVRTTVELDALNRILLSRELRRVAGIAPKQKLVVSATPGRIVLEIPADSSGRIVKRGKLKVWTGAVPATPIKEAVGQARHYTR